MIGDSSHLKFKKFNHGVYRCSSISSNFASSICKAEVLLHLKKLSSDVFLHIVFVRMVLGSSTEIPVEKLHADSVSAVIVLFLFEYYLSLCAGIYFPVEVVCFYLMKGVRW